MRNCDPIAREEVNRTLAHMRKGKAADEDYILIELDEAAGPRFLRELLELFNIIQKQCQITGKREL